jgi:hypothetical protein
MPGTGAAMQFAQRLGIGRYVPCILVFTDIGQLHMDLLPMQGLPVETVYEHVRGWIDGFYERNRFKIDQWAEVETALDQFASEARSSLESILQWRRERLAPWQHIAAASKVLHALEGSGNAWAEVDILRPHLPDHLRSQIDDAFGRLRRSKAENREAVELEQMMQEETLANLRQWRQKLEVEALSNSAEPLHKRLFDQTLARRFHEMFDEYERVTRDLEYPHRQDPLIVQVPIKAPVVVAAKVSPSEAEHPELKLRDAMGIADDLEIASQLAKEEVSESEPATRLWLALTRHVAADRLTALFATDELGLKYRVQSAIAEHRVSEILAALQLPELRAVAKAVGANAGQQSPASMTEEEALKGNILAALGLHHGQFDVFLSYNSHDRAAVMNLAHRLRAIGIIPWIDVEQLRPSEWYQDVIQAIIPRVKVAAIIFGRHGLGRWQELELRAFISQCVERGLSLIPVLLPGVADVPAELAFTREAHFVRFVERLDESEAFNALSWGITGTRSDNRGSIHR